ncbi:MAG TPA: ferrous iron transport protein A [Pirellulales bacterium]|nr:ferrous iron transport protein A [Pirellulales bacterium]
MTGLDRLTIGDRGRVVRIIGADEITARLFEMGLTPGVAVELLGCAPLGDPIEVELRGYRLSLRKTEAARVEVEQLL